MTDLPAPGAPARTASASLAGAARGLGARGWLPLAFGCGTVLCAALQRLFLDGARQDALDLGEALAVTAMASVALAASRPPPALGRADRAILLLCALAWLLPEPRAVYAGMGFAGLWLALRPPRGGPLALTGQLWLALSVNQLWGKLAFELAYQTVEPLEVAAMARVGRLFYPALLLQGMDLRVRPDWSVVILEGCSSFHGLSLTLLAWLCVVRIAGRAVDRAALLALAASAALVVAANVARILLMLPSAEAYAYWHDGGGSTLAALATASAAVVPVLLALELRRPAARVAP